MLLLLLLWRNDGVSGCEGGEVGVRGKGSGQESRRKWWEVGGGDGGGRERPGKDSRRLWRRREWGDGGGCSCGGDVEGKGQGEES